MIFGLRCSGAACRPHPASLPVRVPAVESLLSASFSFASRLRLAFSLRLPSSAPIGSFHPIRFCPCWAHPARGFISPARPLAFCSNTVDGVTAPAEFSRRSSHERRRTRAPRNSAIRSFRGRAIARPTGRRPVVPISGVVCSSKAGLRPAALNVAEKAKGLRRASARLQLDARGVGFPGLPHPHTRTYTVTVNE